MIDTIMALWNQPPQRRGLKVFLTFLLICISISLLVAIVSNAWLTHTNRTGQNSSVQQHVTQEITETASISQIAVTATPTTVVIAQNCANSGQKATSTSTQHSTAIAQTGFGPHQQTTPTATTPHLRPTSSPISKATPQPAPTQHVTVLVMRNLPQTEGTHVYQGWVLKGKQPTSIGLLNIQNGVATVDIAGNVQGFDAVAVSLEPGPLATQAAPVGPVVAVGSLHAASASINAVHYSVEE